jgi:hypothetical protein
MGNKEYILWSARGGWLTRAAFTHSDFRQAQVFPLEEALMMCKLHKSSGAMGLVPVELSLVKELNK